MTVAGGTLTGGSIDAAKVVPTSGTISAVLTGADGLAKSTAGDVVLSGANTFTGTANVLTAGTLNINNAAALGAATAAWSLNGGTIDNTSGAAITSGASGDRGNVRAALTGGR